MAYQPYFSTCSRSTSSRAVASASFPGIREGGGGDSGILPDLTGFETSRGSIEIIADRIAAAVLGG